MSAPLLKTFDIDGLDKTLDGLLIKVSCYNMLKLTELMVYLNDNNIKYIINGELPNPTLTTTVTKDATFQLIKKFLTEHNKEENNNATYKNTAYVVTYEVTEGSFYYIATEDEKQNRLLNSLLRDDIYKPSPQAAKSRHSLLLSQFGHDVPENIEY